MIGALIVMAAASSLLALGLTSSAGAAQSRVAAHPAVHSNGSGCDSWNGGSGPWTDASNWSTGSVPTAADNACISAAGTYTVTLEGGQAVNSLIVGGGASGTQTLAINSFNGVGSALSFQANSEIQVNGAINLNSSGSQGNAANLDAGADTGATIVNDGTLDDNGIAGQFGCNITNDADGSMTVAATSTIEGSFTFANSGSFTVSAGAELEGSGLGFTQSGGTFDNAGTALLQGANFTQSGGADTGNPIQLDGNETFDDSAGTGSLEIEGVNTTDGTIPAGQTVTLVSSPGVGTEMNVSPSLTNDGTLVMTSTGTSSSNNSVSSGVLTNNSTIDVSGTNSVDTFSGIVIDNESSGVLDVTNPGSEFSNGTLNNEGTMDVGAGAGVTLNDENYEVTVQSGKTAEVTGAGSVALSGSPLQVTTVGKLPKAKTIFTLFDTSGGVSGTFGSLDFPAAAYNVAYTPTTVTLTAQKPFKAKAKAVKATAGTSATVTVATLSKLPASGTITASINWGDGSVASAGTMTTSGNKGTVAGTHTYASAGHYTVTTTITDSDGTIFTVTGKATVKS